MEIEDDNRTLSMVLQPWRLADHSKTQRFSGGSPQRSNQTMEHRKASKLVRAEQTEKQSSRENPLCKFLKHNQSFLSGQSDSCGVQLSPSQCTTEHRLFVTPPKRCRNNDNHELTKREYRQRKLQCSEQQETSRFQSDYEVMGTLGSGCFGTVKRCRNKVDGAVYAVKIMGCNDRKNINEVRAMAVLSNKECSNIVRYHHSWIEGRQLYMVMEWCETSLRPLLEEHKKSHRYFSEGELKSILQDTLKALSELHQYQVVHLDVKPENILKTFAGRYKLADLGLCRQAVLTYGEEISEGDGKYMAREILNNYNHVVPDLQRADVFSLGMTMFELMSLDTLPYNGLEWHSMRDGAIQERLDALNHLYSRELIKIIKNMTEPRFSFRLTSSELLQRRYFIEYGGRQRKSRFERHFSI